MNGLSDLAGQRVLLVGVGAERYGSDRSLLALAQGLVERGWSVRVVVPQVGPLVDDLLAVGAGITVAPVGVFRRAFGPAEWLRYWAWDLPRSVGSTARLARHADVVHVNVAPALGAALGARLARRPLVWHVREISAGRGWRWYGRLVRAVAGRVIVNSAATAAAAGLAPDRDAVVVYNGLDFGPLPSGPRAVGDRGPGVVMVGRINAWKGQDVLVEAVGLLRARGVALRADFAGDVFAGTDRYRDDLAGRIDELGLQGQIRLLGFVDDVSGLLDGYSMFALPTRRPEPFGLALIEAMARGLAVVASDAGGPREIVRPGVTGLLVPPGDAPALADALEGLWRDDSLRSSLGAAAAEDVRRRFSAERMVDAVVDVYAAVRSGSRHGR